jgi:riboflavin transporter FmnP
MKETDWQVLPISFALDLSSRAFFSGTQKEECVMENETKSATAAGKSGRYNVRKLTTMGMLTALGVLLATLVHVPLFPAAPFLKYDPADIAILIGTMIYGPLAGFLLTFLVNFLQAVLSSSGSGWIGFVMNVASTGAMAIMAGNLYNHSKKNLPGAALSLGAGALTMTVVMAGMNLLLTPIFMGTPLDTVLQMMVPVIIPFNLLKAGINCVATFLIYKPIQKLVG